jgi:hypothetical protein
VDLTPAISCQGWRPPAFFRSSVSMPNAITVFFTIARSGLLNRSVQRHSDSTGHQHIESQLKLMSEAVTEKHENADNKLLWAANAASE